MLKTKVITLLLFINLTVKGQVVNNLSSDRTNIYFHTLDSVVKILRKTETFNFVNVYGEKSITQNFPDIVDGIKLFKISSDSKKTPKIKKEEARLVIKSLRIIRDEFKISIMTWGHSGRLGEGLYIFRYKYMPETMTFILKEIKVGNIL